MIAGITKVRLKTGQLSRKYVVDSSAIATYMGEGDFPHGFGCIRVFWELNKTTQMHGEYPKQDFEEVAVDPIIDAIALLSKEGFTLTPPQPKPAPLKGKVFIARRGNRIYALPDTMQRPAADAEILAIVDWTEGDGIVTDTTPGDLI